MNDVGNEQMRSNWSSDASGWVANERLFDHLFAPVTDEIVSAARWSAGQHALDVGCGSGTLLERGTADGVTMSGIDISASMVEAAVRRVSAATVVVGDAQNDDLSSLPGSPYDRVVSRFGVMFFADPTAAFANLHRATGPAGRLTFACWRSSRDNPIFTLGSSLLVEQIERITGPRVRPDGYVPGPTGLADRDFLSGVLADAGWTEVSIDPFDFELDHGFDGSDGVDNRMRMIFGTSVGPTAERVVKPAIGDDAWAELLSEVRDEVASALRGDALRLPAATWLVTARSAP